MSSDAEITDQWLPRDPAAQQAAALGGVAVPAPAMSTAPAAGATAANGAPPPSPAMLQVAVGTPLAAVERQVILATLEHFGHHKERTAAALGVSLKTLYNRLKEYGL
jgi:two-component system response regulator AtoC